MIALMTSPNHEHANGLGRGNRTWANVELHEFGHRGHRDRIAERVFDNEVAIGQVLQFVPESIYQAAALEDLFSTVQEHHTDMTERTVRRRIDHAYEQHLCLRTGDGKRGDPHRYYLSEPGRQVAHRTPRWTSVVVRARETRGNSDCSLRARHTV